VSTGVYRLEAGERLGDLVLAAEQPVGSGTVVVMGDSFSLTNEGGVWGYAWTGRLISYLANRPVTPQAGWRQLLTAAMCLGLLALLAWRFDPQRLVWTPLLFALSLAACTAASRHVTRVVPDGRSANNLAYIDASHLEAYSETDWSFDSLNGLALTLMRHGYLTATLPEITRERLERAAVVVSIAPTRPFSPSERYLLYQYVSKGGIWICTVGAEQAAASHLLLEDFGIRVPQSPTPTTGRWREPEPMGRIRSVYLTPTDDNGQEYEVAVNFHAGWPVEWTGDEGNVVVYGRNEAPIIVCRSVGRGQVVVVGDTGFAMNKNLEYVGGQPFDGRYENAEFWRWLITHLTAQPAWIPPPPAENVSPSNNTQQEAGP
jgi:hypothetical protein